MNSGKATAATGGVGTASHLAGVLLQNSINARFQFVPYRGSAPALQDLLAGEVDLFIDQAASALPLARSGKIRAYAVAAKTRSPAAPDVPTTDEAGLPGFYVSNWHAFWVPKGTSNDIIATLNEAVVKALADPMVRQRLTDLGQEIFPREQQTPEALGAYQKAEIEKWWPIIKAAGIKAE
jgi:tripartite-type tricarboxylate transporter receptor subunit TctC